MKRFPQIVLTSVLAYLIVTSARGEVIRPRVFRRRQRRRPT